MIRRLPLLLALWVLTACQSGVPRASDLPLLQDPLVKTGVLNNGLTYFILQNPKPEGRASLRLAVKAGSLQEEENQRGLAHFVEHMAFNGSKNFSKNALIDYFETIGMDFGHDLNAYTSFEETVYMLEVPTDKPEIMDQSLTVLSDWLSGLSFDPAEVDKERGVVQEEWRLSRDAETRRFETQWPLLAGGSRYAFRLPIGQMDIIRTAPAEELKRFYTRWYRPEHAAIVIVGSVDPVALETSLREKFSSPEKAQPVTPELPTLPLPKGRSLQLFEDPELTTNLIQIVRFRRDPSGDLKTTLKVKILEDLAARIANQRLADRTRQAQPPFLQAQWDSSPFVAKTRGLSLSVIPPEGGYLPSLEAFLVEVQKLRTGGVTKREWEREVEAYRKEIETAWARRGDVESSVRAGALVQHFLKAEPYLADQTERDLYLSLLSGITKTEIDRVFTSWMEEDNELVLISGTDKEGNPLPAEREVEALIASVRERTYPPEEEKAPVVLMPVLPKAGSVVKETRMDGPGLVRWDLSNGGVVYFKPTDFKAQEVLFQALSRGGSSLVSDQDYLEAQLASGLLSESGWGNLSQEELQETLADKQIRVNFGVEEAMESFQGSSTTDDLETFFQLLHLKMSAPRRDPQAFESVRQRYKDYLANRLNDPQQVFSDEIQRVLTANHLRGRPLTPEALDTVDLDRMLEIYRQRFTNAGDFTFFFVGAAPEDQLKGFVETYLASLPGGPKETPRDLGIRPLKPPYTGEVAKGMEPRSQVVLLFPSEGILEPEDLVAMDALKDVLEIRLREAIREERGGTYGVQAGFSYRREPYGSLRYFISFGCAPDRINELKTAALVEMDKLRKGEFVPTDLEKVREIRRRNLETNLKTNGFWMNQMISYLYTIQAPEKIMEFQKRIDRLTVETLQPLAQKFMNPQGLLQLVLTQEPAGARSVTP